MGYRDEYVNYLYVKSFETIFEDNADNVFWFKGKEYEVIEVFKNDRIVEVRSEQGKLLISLDDDDFEFIEA